MAGSQGQRVVYASALCMPARCVCQRVVYASVLCLPASGSAFGVPVCFVPVRSVCQRDGCAGPLYAGTFGRALGVPARCVVTYSLRIIALKTSICMLHRYIHTLCTSKISEPSPRAHSPRTRRGETRWQNRHS